MRPNTKMSSGQATFDLKAAREEIAGYDPKKTNAFCHARTATLLKLALEEIERLNSDKLWLGKRLADQAREIGQLKSEAHERVGYYGQRISELNAAYQKAQNSNLLRKQAYESLEKIANKQRAALKKLGQAKRERGKALVEERISGEFSDWIENQCLHWDIDEEPFCVELDGPCEYMEGKCPISMELHRIAREQLRLEGKL